MKERPILFSAPMVRAILAGTKTQTRRIVKPQPQPNGGEGLHPVAPYCNPHGSWAWVLAATGHGSGGNLFDCPYGQPGDRLWVRETWQGPLLDSEEHEAAQFREDGPDAFKKPGFCAYRATDTLDAVDLDGNDLGWRPSIHMPRWASRISLEITGVRVERLQDISEADAIAEGISAKEDGRYHCGCDDDGEILCKSPVTAYAWLWNSINGDGAWAANPWVWVVEFKRVAA